MHEWRLYLYRFVVSILPEMAAFKGKAMLLRWCGARVGDGVSICSSVKISGSGDLVIGDNVWISSETLLRASPSSTIIIGNNTRIGPRCLLWTGTHNVVYGEKVACGNGIAKNIKIGDGCWLGGGGVIVCAGAELGDCTIIAAGGVAAGNIPSRVMAAGVPAQVKKSLN